MSEQSQKEEMSAVIRAQRERQNVPRSIAPDPPPVAPPEPRPEAEPERPKSLFARLRGK